MCISLSGGGCNHRPPLPLACKSLLIKHNFFWFNKVPFLKTKLFSAQSRGARVARRASQIGQVFLVFQYRDVQMTNSLQRNSCHNPVRARPGPEVLLWSVCLLWSLCGENRVTKRRSSQRMRLDRSRGCFRWYKLN